MTQAARKDESGMLDRGPKEMDEAIRKIGAESKETSLQVYIQESKHRSRVFLDGLNTATSDGRVKGNGQNGALQPSA